MPQTAEVGIAIHGPIYFQSITPDIPGAGSKQAILYFQPPGSTPNSSHAANPDNSICTVSVVKAIPIIPTPNTIREKNTPNPAP